MQHPLKLKSQVVVSSLPWMLRTKLGFSGRAVVFSTMGPSLQVMHYCFKKRDGHIFRIIGQTLHPKNE